MAITWYTQPPGGFASFYYYDTSTRELVRIRLELNRSDNDGPICIYRSNRYVGFSPVEIHTAERNAFTIQNGQINAGSLGLLATQPTPGLNTYDFSSQDGINPIAGTTPHRGNMVTDNPVLPNAVTVLMMQQLSAVTISLKQDIRICASNDQVAILSQRINEILSANAGRIS